MKARLALWSGALTIALSIGSLHGGSGFDSCSDELDRLKRAASDAGDKAKEAQNAEDDLDAARHRMEDACSSSSLFPSQYRCQSARSEYQSKKSDFESASDDFGSEYDTVQSRMRSVQSACVSAAAPLVPIPGVAPEYQRMCRSIRRLATLGLNAQNLATTCSSVGLPADQCGACLRAR